MAKGKCDCDLVSQGQFAIYTENPFIIRPNLILIQIHWRTGIRTQPKVKKLSFAQTTT